MKKYISYIMMIMLGGLAFSSCNQEVIQDNSYGYLGVSLENDLSEDVVTRADETTEDLVFSVDVLNASGSVASSVDDHRQITLENPIKLNVGNYTAVARSGENLNAAFENPYYEGRTAKSFKINPEQTTSVELACSLANTIFSVEFPEDFSKFTDYEVSVTNGEGDKLVFSNNPQAGNPLEAGLSAKGYFAVTGTLTWELYLKNTDGGEYRATDTYTGVKAKQHYHLKFAMGQDEAVDGAFVIKVNLENSWDDSDHGLVLDFSKKNMPNAEANEELGAVSGESVSVLVGSSTAKTLTFSAPEGMKNLILSHDNTVLEEAGLPKMVDIVDAPENTITALNEAGVVVTDAVAKIVTANSTNVSVDVTTLFAELPIGLYEIDFTVIDSKGRYDKFDLVIEVISDVDAEAVAAYVGWAAFAKIEGRFFDSAKKDVVAFQYKKVADTEWIDVNTGLDFNMTSRRYSTILTGLAPSTEYVFRAVSDEDKDTKEISFTTAAASVLHNFNFDSWTNSDKFPNASGYSVWDSANSSGAATTTSPTTDSKSGNAAKLESKKAFGLLAAGNIFTGNFVEVAFGSAGAGAKLNWGTPFTGRPLAIRGYYKYSPKTIDNAKDPYADKKGQTDQCQIVVSLLDWDEPFLVNTSTASFVDFDNDPGVLAYGQFNSAESSSEYIQITIPLVYRDVARMPKYIIFAAASSRYGDYFTGAEGSIMYIDEFEFIYDPQELTDEEYANVFSLVEPF